jgi:hypothetical protein
MQLRGNTHTEFTAVSPLGQSSRRGFADCCHVYEGLSDEGPDAG